MSLLPEIRTHLLGAAGHSRRCRVPAGTFTITATAALSVAIALVFVLDVHHAPAALGDVRRSAGTPRADRRTGAASPAANGG
jgi:hypothetical protein